MDDPEAMGLFERAQDLERDVEHARHRLERLGVEDRLQVLPREQLHHEVRAAVGGLAEVVHADAVRVIERARGASLVLEALDHLRVGDERP